MVNSPKQPDGSQGRHETAAVEERGRADTDMATEILQQQLLFLGKFSSALRHCFGGETGTCQKGIFGDNPRVKPNAMRNIPVYLAKKTYLWCF